MMKFGIALLVAFVACSAFAQDQKDATAVDIAKQTVEAMGGQQAYDETRYLTWKFFGRRLHVWDKWTGDHRFEDGQGLVVIMNLNTKEGKAWQDGEAIADETELATKLKGSYEAWINDSYWLVMPYKLLDPGVNLGDEGMGKTEDGRDAHVLSLTFNDVGVTPQNKYLVYVDAESKLVTQWDFYQTAETPEPRFKTPWANWSKHGQIMLSADRGQFKHSDVAVLESLPATTFTDPAPVELGVNKP